LLFGFFAGLGGMAKSVSSKNLGLVLESFAFSAPAFVKVNISVISPFAGFPSCSKSASVPKSV
jgi:hypothetical protein